jgi:protein-tyrosine phosphatase
MGYVDLHAHVLPGLDDGATDDASSTAMLKGLAAVGYERVTATPHQKLAQFMPTREAIDQAYAATRQRIADAAIPLELGLAAENFWDSAFFERSQDGSFPRYDGGKAFLFEISPPEIPVHFEDTLFQLRCKDYLPVMAHPERYQGFYDDLERLIRIAENVALVVDLGALAGYHGWRAGRVAKRLVSERIAHAAASDVHSPSDIRVAAEGIAWIKKKLGPEAVTRLLDENPRAILAGHLPQA